MINEIRKTSCSLLFLIILVLPAHTFAQKDSLRARIEHIVEDAKGTVGVSIIGLETPDTLTINGNVKFPMQSVYKFPLALAILHLVDLGKLSLGQTIHVTKQELLPDTWSPLREKYRQGGVDITLAELLDYTVSESDNNGCDILFRLIGGTDFVDRYIHGLGILDMAIAATEAEMHKDWQVQYTNWSSPAAMSRLFQMFYRDKILTGESKEYLWKDMAKSSSGSKRIKGLLPQKTIVAHKTGSSDTNDQGVTAAVNDAGIVVLPNGKKFVIVVFVSNFTADMQMCENVIARIAKAAWDAYSAQ